VTLPNKGLLTDAWVLYAHPRAAEARVGQAEAQALKSLTIPRALVGVDARR
jgi:hypothetical protein